MDDAWLAEPPKRSRFRMLMVVTLAGALIFLAGVQVQKRYGVASSAAAAGPAAAIDGGMPSGFTPPGGGQGGPVGGDQGSDSQDADSGTETVDATAVIGTVVSVKDGVWTVEDLGGTVHTVTVDASVRIVQESALTADQVAAGATVDVSGSADDQGRVTATTITVR